MVKQYWYLSFARAAAADAALAAERCESAISYANAILYRESYS